MKSSKISGNDLVKVLIVFLFNTFPSNIQNLFFQIRTMVFSIQLVQDKKRAEQKPFLRCVDLTVLFQANYKSFSICASNVDFSWSQNAVSKPVRYFIR